MADSPKPPGPVTPRRDGGAARAAATRLLEVERDRHRGVRCPGVLGIHLPFGNVAHVVLDDAHAHERRRLADRPDAPRLLDDDLPDLLRVLDSILLLHP